ncbi:hypothetical protein [Rhizobium lusitanum]|uniref:hypothetical protein n=1 Tax=Rhizobium lusitanum TaxID=293958 RepID=UPI0019562360|nr:hypothetical protein [Rhizobium lusitanum]MBM7045427.1 hypothetical protein [Rhizobium lusitanum]
MKMLSPMREDEYAGYSYGMASRRAQEVCQIAGATGQTIIAAQHLHKLAEIMRDRGPLVGIAGREMDKLLEKRYEFLDHL